MSRFEDIASLVPRDARSVADIGYDHGYLIRRLARTHPNLRIVGVERQAHAAERLRRRMASRRYRQARVDLVHGDGLEPLATRDVQIIVLSGLDERRIVQILNRSLPHLSRFRRMVLCPVVTRGILRPYLRSIGWAAVDERLGRLRERFYQAYAVEPGAPSSTNDRWLIGPGLFDERHPLLREFLFDLKRSYDPLIHHYGDGRGHIRQFHASVSQALQTMDAAAPQRPLLS